MTQEACSLVESLPVKRSVGKGKGKGKAPQLPQGLALASSVAAKGKGASKAAPEKNVATADAAPKSIANVKLRPTTTRVTRRDGTVTQEVRSNHGFEEELLEERAAVPQYVRDQEAGFSRLDPKVFDPSSNRWCASITPGNDESGGDANAWLLSRGRLRMVTYNVWFSLKRQRLRAQALFEILEREDADIVCLQEVTQQFLVWLCEQSWVRAGYSLSDPVGTTLRGSQLAYGVVMLFRKSLTVSSLRLHALPTRMNRAALVSSITICGAELRVATVHLESLNNTLVRKSQLERIFQVLQSDSEADGDAKAVGSSVLAGDMNFDEGRLEDAAVQGAGYRDCWRCNFEALAEDDMSVKSVARGITMPVDDENEVPSRIDRVFLGQGHPRAEWQLAPLSMHRLGMEDISISAESCQMCDCAEAKPTACVCDNRSAEASSESDVDMPNLIPVTLPGKLAPCNRPSDHYGLCADFEIVNRNAST